MPRTPPAPWKCADRQSVREAPLAIHTRSLAGTMRARRTGRRPRPPTAPTTWPNCRSAKPITWARWSGSKTASPGWRIKGPDLAMERRLDNIEHALAGMLSRLEQSDPSAALADTLRQVNQRLDAVEKNHNEMLAELRAGLAQAPQAAHLWSWLRAFESALAEIRRRLSSARFEPSAFETAARAAVRSAGFRNVAETQARTASKHPEFESRFLKRLRARTADSLADMPGCAGRRARRGLRARLRPSEAFASGCPRARQFRAKTHSPNNFEMPQDLADALAQPVPRTTISSARRAGPPRPPPKPRPSATAKRLQLEPARRPRRPTKPARAIWAFWWWSSLRLLALAAGLLFNQRNSRTARCRTKPSRRHGLVPTTPRTVAAMAQASPTRRPATTAEPAGPDARPRRLRRSGADHIGAGPAQPCREPAAGSAGAAEGRTTEAAARSVSAPAKARRTSTDRVAAAANAGNPIAETIIGLQISRRPRHCRRSGRRR